MTEEEILQFGVDSSFESCEKPWEYSQKMLEKVSRTFALNIAILSPDLQKPVLLAYLFCRMADTLEDDPELSGHEKDLHLKRFSAIFQHSEISQDFVQEFRAQLPSSWNSVQNNDQFLTSHPQWPLSLHQNLPREDFRDINSCVVEMCEGMSEYSLRTEKSGEKWMSLNDLADLDRYCYYVAGTVGNMLCDLFRNHSSLINENRYSEMKKLSVSFGLGLQLVNIIKDMAEDSKRGICFVPEDLVKQEGIRTQDLTDPQHFKAANRIMRKLIQKAIVNLNDALEYTLLIPRREMRIRLFCIWPLFMAVETLEQCAVEPHKLLNPQDKVKISRKQVKNIIQWSFISFWSNSMLKSRFERHIAHLRNNDLLS